MADDPRITYIISLIREIVADADETAMKRLVLRLKEETITPQIEKETTTEQTN